MKLNVDWDYEQMRKNSVIKCDFYQGSDIVKVIETETVQNRKTGEKFQVRLLKRNEEDWGVDTTIKNDSTFGFSEESARNIYQNIIYSWNYEE